MKKICSILFGVILVFALNIFTGNSVCSAQIYETFNHHISTQILAREFETNPAGHDGSLKINISPELLPLVSVLWTYPDGITISSDIVLHNLTSGIYSVVVMALECENKIVYQNYVSLPTVMDALISADDLSSMLTNTTVLGCGDVRSASFTPVIPDNYIFNYDASSQTGSSYTQDPISGRPSMTLYGEGNFDISYSVTSPLGQNFEYDATAHVKNLTCAFDPNEIKGPDGYKDSIRFVSATDKMRYTINFENSPDFATAPASRIKITYSVPPEQKISSFRLSDFGFGSFVFTVPSNASSYNNRIDVSDSLGVWVDVTAGIDIVNNQLFWIFQSIDPATGYEPSSSQLGFLLINDENGSGEGYVSFSILPNSNIQTGDYVDAEASIIFDENAAIGTNIWHNTFDAVSPTSHLSLSIDPADSLSCTFSVSASDDPTDQA